MQLLAVPMVITGWQNAKHWEFKYLTFQVFEFPNFRGQKLLRISRILVQSAKICSVKSSELLNPRKFVPKMFQNKPSAKVNVDEKFQKQGIFKIWPWKK